MLLKQNKFHAGRFNAGLFNIANALPLGQWFSAFEELIRNSILSAGVLLVTWLHIALFIMDLSCQGFLCVWIISRFLWVRGSNFMRSHSLTASTLTLCAPTFSADYIAPLSTPTSRSGSRGSNIFCVFFPVAALLFNSDHVNHQSECDLWVNLILNLNWLVQRQSVYFPATFLSFCPFKELWLFKISSFHWYY